jgi:hypothetical protein
MTKSGPRQNQSFFNAFYDFEASGEENKAQPGNFFRSCQLNRRVVKSIFKKKLGFGLGKNLAIIGVKTYV